jgi:hypothetical protein
MTSPYLDRHLRGELEYALDAWRAFRAMHPGPWSDAERREIARIARAITQARGADERAYLERIAS